MTSKISGTGNPRISVHAQNSNAVPKEMPNAVPDACRRAPNECRRNPRRQLRLHPQRIAENFRRRSQSQAVPPNNTFNHRGAPPNPG